MATALDDAVEPVNSIVRTVARSATEIRQGLIGRRSSAAEENPSGETQLEADVWADDLLYDRLSRIEGVAQYASEEREEVLDCGDDVDLDDGVAVALDPLDGSSNLKSNNTMGTIVGIYDEPLPSPGEALLGACYVLYGPITTMVVATEDGVSEYELGGGEATVVQADVTLPDDPVVYGVGGRVPDWPPAIEAYVSRLESELKLRYGGAMIGDVNQVLTYGGLFAYPTLESSPEGKLRVQFEGNPIGYILEQAGGRSSDGHGSLLAVEPTELHQRTPLYVGNEAYVDLIEDVLADA
ncbi:class 1 fructose-bisphosphatase [Saliphagus sp. GCM10025334]